MKRSPWAAWKLPLHFLLHSIVKRDRILQSCPQGWNSNGKKSTHHVQYKYAEPLNLSDLTTKKAFAAVQEDRPTSPP